MKELEILPQKLDLDTKTTAKVSLNLDKVNYMNKVA
jgi:hypothetical protein